MIDSYICKSENFSDRGDFSEPNNIVIGVVTTPHLMYYAGDRQFPFSFDKEECNRIWKSQFARQLPFYRCVSNFVLWLRKIPPVAYKGSVKFQICLSSISYYIVFVDEMTV